MTNPDILPGMMVVPKKLPVANSSTQFSEECITHNGPFQVCAVLEEPEAAGGHIVNITNYMGSFPIAAFQVASAKECREATSLEKQRNELIAALL